MDTIMAFFSKIRAIFFRFSKKGREGTPPPTPPLAARDSGQHTFSPTKNGIQIQLFPPFCSPRRNGERIPPFFHPSPHLHFEIDFPSPGASGTISTLKMSQMVEILISDLVLIVN